MRIQYRYPKLYDLLVHRILYRKNLAGKVAEEVGRDHTVFDVAAGYGYISSFLDPSNQYYGIDLNERFVRDGRENEIDLEVKDIFDPLAYEERDVFLVIDIIHHLSSEKMKNLFDLVFAHAGQKVIIVDPSFPSISRRYGILGKFVGWMFRVLDDDEFSKVEKWLTDEEYEELFQNRFGSEYGKEFRLRQEKVGGHHLVVFERKLKAAVMKHDQQLGAV